MGGIKKEIKIRYRQKDSRQKIKISNNFNSFTKIKIISILRRRRIEMKNMIESSTDIKLVSINHFHLNHPSTED
jgi:hypothetical protein